MYKRQTQYRSIADTLDGSVIVGNEHGYFIEGKVVVGAFQMCIRDRNYVFHKRKKRMGKIVDNGKEKSGFCV